MFQKVGMTLFTRWEQEGKREGGSEEGKAGWKEDGRKKSGREGRNKSPCVCILNIFHTSFTF
jgi:hypothetical protein